MGSTGPMTGPFEERGEAGVADAADAACEHGAAGVAAAADDAAAMGVAASATASADVASADVATSADVAASADDRMRGDLLREDPAPADGARSEAAWSDGSLPASVCRRVETSRRPDGAAVGPGVAGPRQMSPPSARTFATAALRAPEDAAAIEARCREVRDRIEAGYERLARGLRIIAYEILDDEHEAEDTAHDAFAIVLEQAVTVRDPQAVEAWLRRTVRNLAVNRLRRRRRCRVDPRATDESLDQDEATGPRVVRRSGSAELDPCAAVAAEAAFAGLRPELREAATLHFLGGRTCAAVGLAQGVAEGCARTRVHRARRQLLRGLFGSGDEE